MIRLKKYFWPHFSRISPLCTVSRYIRLKKITDYRAALEVGVFADEEGVEKVAHFADLLGEQLVLLGRLEVDDRVFEVEVDVAEDGRLAVAQPQVEDPRQHVTLDLLNVVHHHLRRFLDFIHWASSRKC